MKIAVSTPRQMHAGLLLNVLASQGHDLSFYTSSPPKKISNLNPSVDYRFTPKLLEIFAEVTRIRLGSTALAYDSVLFDRQVSARLGKVDLFYGWATASLFSGSLVSRQGGLFVLDRACPFVDFQQSLVRGEAEKLGVSVPSEPTWYRERQIEEYEVADAIVVPSEYSRKSYSAHLTQKIVKAPICGRNRAPERLPERLPGNEFVLGTVGGNPLRKGLLYLLQAWQQLALPNAKLRIRSGTDLSEYPALKKLVESQSNVEMVGYVDDINRFYQTCDAFVLPSVDDGFGMVLLEAMANGVPCVATTHCGSSELITRGVDGIVVEPFSADKLAEPILALYQSVELRQVIGMAGRATALRIRSSSEEKLYDRAIEGLLLRLAGAELAGHR